MNKARLLNSSIGEYRVIDFLGAGGMGEVYRAVHSKLGRVAAIKVLGSAALDNGSLAHRFFNEACIQAGIQHPNIATLYEFIELNGQPCIIMEYIDGHTLAERVQPHGPLSTGEALRIFQSVVEAVGHIHSFGIIHRDIKSNNIKISTSGQVKLLDFGIAKSESSPKLTETGDVVGTLEYLSPEQLRTGTADARSDIWALGVLLYEITSGQKPFVASTLGELYEKITKVNYVPPSKLNPSLPADVMTIISRCLKKNPADRYQSAEALLQDLIRFSTLAGTTRRRDGLPHHINNRPAETKPARGPLYFWAKSNVLKLSIATSVMLLFLVFLGIYLAMSNRGAQTPDGPLKTVLIDTSDRKAAGAAEIYEDGERIGETPLIYEAPIGKQVNLTLKRDKFDDAFLSFQMDVQTSNYDSVVMKKKGQ